MIKVCQVFVFTFVLLLFEIFKQFNGNIRALISVELYEMLHTVVNDLINLEQEICLIAQELSAHIFVLISVQNIAIGDGRQYGFDQVLESLVDQVLLLLLELGAPLLLAEVLFKVLLDLVPHKGLGFQYPLVH
jgi:hypothetical protein